MQTLSMLSAERCVCCMIPFFACRRSGIIIFSGVRVMFTILQCENQRKGLAKLFVRRKYFFHMVSDKGMRFMVLTINDKDKIDWKRIENILGKTARKTLLAEDIPRRRRMSAFPLPIRRLTPIGWLAMRQSRCCGADDGAKGYQGAAAR